MIDLRRILESAVFAGLILAALPSWADAVEDAINAPDRLAGDLERDSRSRPDVTLPLLDIQAGDRVADIFGGSGYYSELISHIVGDSGEVLLVNNAAYAQFAKKGLDARMNGRDVGQITLHTREADAMDLGVNTLDAALIIMSYHDLYYVDEENGWSAIEPAGFLEQIATALKPGGRFLIVDHHAEAGTGSSAAQDLHRIDVEFAKQDIASNGFTLISESTALGNENDDRTLNVFDPAVRGKTDRFILVFEKT